jgi:hypothetical protein
MRPVRYRHWKKQWGTHLFVEEIEGAVELKVKVLHLLLRRFLQMLGQWRRGVQHLRPGLPQCPVLRGVGREDRRHTPAMAVLVVAVAVITVAATASAS